VVRIFKAIGWMAVELDVDELLVKLETTSCDASCDAMMGGNRMKWRM
jgi:hypothetical protein